MQTNDRPMTLAEALALARTVDPSAESMGTGVRDCLLVANEKAPAVLALFPGSYEDPNEGLPWTRLVLGLGDGDTHN